MSHARRWIGIAMLSLPAAAACGEPPSLRDNAGSGLDIRRGADHHVHLRSAAFSEAQALFCEKKPDECGDPSGPTTRDAEDLIPLLDAARLQTAVVLSNAYFLGAPELEGTRFDDAAMVREENRFVFDEVGRFPDRLVGIVSVNPLRDYADKEIQYWLERGGSHGLKLHLANSGFDFRNPAHVARLRVIIGMADTAGLPVVLHLRTRSAAYGAADVDIFLREVLGPTRRVPVQIAHAAGWGRYDDSTDAALGAFADAFVRDATLRGRVWFDLAAVVVPGVEDEALRRLAERMRAVGLDRFVLGTDWDAIADPDDLYPYMYKRLPLSEDEWHRLRLQTAAWLNE